MTRDEILAWYENEEDEKVEWKYFDNLTDDKKLHRCREIAGILKLDSMLAGEKLSFSAGYERIDFWCDVCDFGEGVTVEDLEFLTACGIHYSAGEGHFYMFT